MAAMNTRPSTKATMGGTNSVGNLPGGKGVGSPYNAPGGNMQMGQTGSFSEATPPPSLSGGTMPGGPASMPLPMQVAMPSSPQPVAAPVSNVPTQANPASKIALSAAAATSVGSGSIDTPSSAQPPGGANLLGGLGDTGSTVAGKRPTNPGKGLAVKLTPSNPFKSSSLRKSSMAPPPGVDPAVQPGSIYTPGESGPVINDQTVPDEDQAPMSLYPSPATPQPGSPEQTGQYLPQNPLIPQASYEPMSGGQGARGLMNRLQKGTGSLVRKMEAQVGGKTIPAQNGPGKVAAVSKAAAYSSPGTTPKPQAKKPPTMMRKKAKLIGNNQDEKAGTSGKQLRVVNSRLEGDGMEALYNDPEISRRVRNRGSSKQASFFAQLGIQAVKQADVLAPRDELAAQQVSEGHRNAPITEQDLMRDPSMGGGTPSMGAGLSPQSLQQIQADEQRVRANRGRLASGLDAVPLSQGLPDPRIDDLNLGNRRATKTPNAFEDAMDQAMPQEPIPEPRMLRQRQEPTTPEYIASQIPAMERFQRSQAGGGTPFGQPGGYQPYMPPGSELPDPSDPFAPATPIPTASPSTPAPRLPLSTPDQYANSADAVKPGQPPYQEPAPVATDTAPVATDDAPTPAMPRMQRPVSPADVAANPPMMTDEIIRSRPQNSAIPPEPTLPENATMGQRMAWELRPGQPSASPEENAAAGERLREKFKTARPPGFPADQQYTGPDPGQGLDYTSMSTSDQARHQQQRQQEQANAEAEQAQRVAALPAAPSVDQARQNLSTAETPDARREAVEQLKNAPVPSSAPEQGSGAPPAPPAAPPAAPASPAGSLPPPPAPAPLPPPQPRPPQPKATGPIGPSGQPMMPPKPAPIVPPKPAPTGGPTGPMTPAGKPILPPGSNPPPEPAPAPVPPPPSGRPTTPSLPGQEFKGFTDQEYADRVRNYKPANPYKPVTTTPGQRERQGLPRGDGSSVLTDADRAYAQQQGITLPGESAPGVPRQPLVSSQPPGFQPRQPPQPATPAQPPATGRGPATNPMPQVAGGGAPGSGMERTVPGSANAPSRWDANGARQPVRQSWQPQVNTGTHPDWGTSNPQDTADFKARYGDHKPGTRLYGPTAIKPMTSPMLKGASFLEGFITKMIEDEVPPDQALALAKYAASQNKYFAIELDPFIKEAEEFVKESAVNPTFGGTLSASAALDLDDKHENMLKLRMKKRAMLKMSMVEKARPGMALPIPKYDAKLFKLMQDYDNAQNENLMQYIRNNGDPTRLPPPIPGPPHPAVAAFRTHMGLDYDPDELDMMDGIIDLEDLHEKMQRKMRKQADEHLSDRKISPEAYKPWLSGAASLLSGQKELNPKSLNPAQKGMYQGMAGPGGMFGPKPEDNTNYGGSFAKGPYQGSAKGYFHTPDKDGFTHRISYGAGASPAMARNNALYSKPDSVGFHSDNIGSGIVGLDKVTGPPLEEFGRGVDWQRKLPFVAGTGAVTTLPPRLSKPPEELPTPVTRNPPIPRWRGMPRTDPVMRRAQQMSQSVKDRIGSFLDGPPPEKPSTPEWTKANMYQPVNPLLKKAMGPTPITTGNFIDKAKRSLGIIPREEMSNVPRHIADQVRERTGQPALKPGEPTTIGNVPQGKAPGAAGNPGPVKPKGDGSMHIALPGIGQAITSILGMLGGGDRQAARPADVAMLPAPTPRPQPVAPARPEMPAQAPIAAPPAVESVKPLPAMMGGPGKLPAPVQAPPMPMVKAKYKPEPNYQQVMGQMAKSSPKMQQGAIRSPVSAAPGQVEVPNLLAKTGAKTVRYRPNDPLGLRNLPLEPMDDDKELEALTELHVPKQPVRKPAAFTRSRKQVGIQKKVAMSKKADDASATPVVAPTPDPIPNPLPQVPGSDIPQAPGYEPGKTPSGPNPTPLMFSNKPKSKLPDVPRQFWRHYGNEMSKTYNRWHDWGNESETTDAKGQTALAPGTSIMGIPVLPDSRGMRYGARAGAGTAIAAGGAAALPQLGLGGVSLGGGTGLTGAAQAVGSQLATRGGGALMNYGLYQGLGRAGGHGINAATGMDTNLPDQLGDVGGYGGAVLGALLPGTSLVSGAARGILPRWMTASATAPRAMLLGNNLLDAGMATAGVVANSPDLYEAGKIMPPTSSQFVDPNTGKQPVDKQGNPIEPKPGNIFSPAAIGQQVGDRVGDYVMNKATHGMMPTMADYWRSPANLLMKGLSDGNIMGGIGNAIGAMTDKQKMQVAAMVAGGVSLIAAIGALGAGNTGAALGLGALGAAGLGYGMLSGGSSSTAMLAKLPKERATEIWDSQDPNFWRGASEQEKIKKINEMAGVLGHRDELAAQAQARRQEQNAQAQTPLGQQMTQQMWSNDHPRPAAPAAP